MRARALPCSLALAGLLAACSAPPPERLTAGRFAGPLARLQQLTGRNTHLHTDEIRYRRSDQKLFHCSYTFGVIDARNPGEMVYLAQELRHAIPGDARTPGCIHLAWDGDVVYTVHRGNVDNPAFLSGWDLKPDPADPSKLTPVQLPVLQEPGVSYEGIDTGNGHIYSAQRQKGLGIYRRDGRGRFLRVGTSRDLNNAWGVRVRGTTAFVSDGLAGLAILDVAEPRRPVLLGRANTGGKQARGLALEGHIAYVAAGSAGLVVVDVSNLQAPRVVAKVPTPGSAVRVDYASNQVFVAAWRRARLRRVDAGDSEFIGAVRMTRDISAQGRQAGGAAPPPRDGRPEVTSRTLGVAAVDDVMFVGNWHQIEPVPRASGPHSAEHAPSRGDQPRGFRTGEAWRERLAAGQGHQPGDGAAHGHESRDEQRQFHRDARAAAHPARARGAADAHLQSRIRRQGHGHPAGGIGRSRQPAARRLSRRQPGGSRRRQSAAADDSQSGRWRTVVSQEAKGQVTLLAYFATF